MIEILPFLLPFQNSQIIQNFLRILKIHKVLRILNKVNFSSSEGTRNEMMEKIKQKQKIMQSKQENSDTVRKIAGKHISIVLNSKQRGFGQGIDIQIWDQNTIEEENNEKEEEKSPRRDKINKNKAK